MKIFFLFAASFFISCANQSANVKINEKSADEPVKEIAANSVELNDKSSIETITNNDKYKDSIKNTKGLITLSQEYGKNDFIRFYNEDGSLWYEFTFYDDDSDGRFEYENDEFCPYAFHPDYFLLALKLVGEDSKRYRVIVNEETGLEKYIKKSDKNLKFETWEEHILDTFAIEFNQNENPLRKAPNGKLKKVELSKIDRFETVEVKDKWLKIKWNVESNAEKNRKKTDFGWIKWKEGEKLLIELFYLC